MRSGLLLLMVAAMIAAGCRTVSYQTADSAAVEPAVFSCAELALAAGLAHFLQGRLIEEEHGQGSPLALPYYRVAAQRVPGSHVVHSRIAVEALHRADVQDAVAAMEASYAAATNDPVRQVDLAALYQLANRPDEAAVLFEQSLVGNPTNTAVYIALSNRYFTRGNAPEALDLLERGFAAVPESEALTKYLYQQAHHFVGSGALDQAIGCFALLARWNEEGRAEIQYVIGELQLAQQRIDAAMQTLHDTIKLPHAPAAAFLRLGVLLLEEQRPEEAGSVFRDGRTQYPELASFPFALGGIYAEDGQYEDALEAYEDAMRISQEAQHAPKIDDRQLKLERQNMLIAMAYAQEKLARYTDAAETLRQVLAAFPDNHVAMNFLAYMWAELDTNLDEAYALSKRSLEMQPGNGAYLDTLGWIYYRKGNFEEALVYLEQAREQLGEDPEIILHFGDVYAAKGDPEVALQYWQKSLTADPTPDNRAWHQLEQAGIDPEAWLQKQHQTDEAVGLDGASDDTTAPEPDESPAPHSDSPDETMQTDPEEEK